MAKVVVTGGCGYVGSVLVEELLSDGHEVTVIDLQWFGNYLEPHPSLQVLKEDIRTVKLESADAVIHLAAVADDPTSELNHEQTWEIGALGTQHLCQEAVRVGIKRFIHASSGSVYGIREEHRVTEDLYLTPFSYYNKVKMVAERVVLSYPELSPQIVRPASICGFSPRMRLETTVNQYTIQALETGVIRVNGGSQMHPNAHIRSVTALYRFLLNHPQHKGIYNSITENISKIKLAVMVSEMTDARLDVKGSNDARSYRMDDSKVRSIGFLPKTGAMNAISELCDAYKAGDLRDDPKHYNLKVMKAA